MLERIGNEEYDDLLINERKDVVIRHMRTVKRKTLVVGIGVASLLGIPVLITLIVNLVTGNALDWFFIVLTAIMMLASVTVVPLVLEKNRGVWAILCFTISLTLLLIACGIYIGGTWQNYGRTALIITTACMTLPWGLLLLIKYLNANALVRAGLCVIFGGVFFSMIENVIYWVVDGLFRIQLMSANLSVWNESTTDPNVYLLGFLAGCLAGGILVITGILKRNKKK